MQISPQTRSSARHRIAGIRRRFASACLVIPATLAFTGSAQASNPIESFRPISKSDHALFFKLKGLRAARVASAQANLRSRHRRGHKFERRLNAGRVRSAARRNRLLRVRKPGFVRGGRLKVELSPRGPADPPTPPSSCALDPTNLTAPGCELIKSDTAVAANPEALWGNIECATSSRHQVVVGGADQHPLPTGAGQHDDAFRRLTVFDGDDFYGERCELGRNEHRYGGTGGDGTFMTYSEGERKITFISARFGDSMQIETARWQTILQMKQAQPSANGGGAPIIEVQARGGELVLENDWDRIWSTPISPGVWTRMAFDVHYSQDPSLGSLTMYVDTNGDGDASDTGEQSPTFRISTLRGEISGGWASDGLAPGASIPSHLRAGVYHDAAIECPSGCAIDVDNVQVVR